MATYVLGINAYHGDVSAASCAMDSSSRQSRRSAFAASSIGWLPHARHSERVADGRHRGRDVHARRAQRDPKANLLRKGLFTVTHRPDLRLVLDRVRNAGKVATPHGRSLGVRRPRDDLPRCTSSSTIPPISRARSSSRRSRRGVLRHRRLRRFREHVVRDRDSATPRRVRQGVLPAFARDDVHAVTQFIGFHGYGDEFKVMGLAPYGRPRHVDAIASS
jgi:carbamoyltransferase